MVSVVAVADGGEMAQMVVYCWDYGDCGGGPFLKTPNQRIITDPARPFAGSCNWYVRHNRSGHYVRHNELSA